MKIYRSLSVLIIAGLFAGHISKAQSLTIAWRFDANSKVLASPISKEGIIYIGDEDGNFYALDQSNGNQKWLVQTNGNIQGRATLVGQSIFFESANVFYLVDADTGKEIWRYDPKMEPLSFTHENVKTEYKIDPWDDKRGGATFFDGIIYTGCGNGHVYGFRSTSGELVLDLVADQNSPVRSEVFIDGSELFFGDWNGLLYKYDLAKGKIIWKNKTYEGKPPYPSFGGLNASFVSDDERLYFGARNHVLNVFNKHSGEVSWTYKDAKGGWISGDPVLYEETLYIGGSDNYTMFAFEPKSGDLLWKQTGTKNLYTKPIVTQNWVIYTAGNGYNGDDPGVLIVLDRKNGEVLSQFETPKGTFSSPLMVGQTIIFGCYDGNIYALKTD